ncbi:MAG: hypothetical protein OXB99_17515 [Acidimicrobiaceae bacterium]|nr:hypothetical protein [Acidimicrobiaceae bacterium]
MSPRRPSPRGKPWPDYLSPALADPTIDADPELSRRDRLARARAALAAAEQRTRPPTDPNSEEPRARYPPDPEAKKSKMPRYSARCERVGSSPRPSCQTRTCAPGC